MKPSLHEKEFIFGIFGIIVVIIGITIINTHHFSKSIASLTKQVAVVDTVKSTYSISDTTVPVGGEILIEDSGPSSSGFSRYIMYTGMPSFDYYSYVAIGWSGNAFPCYRHRNLGASNMQDTLFIQYMDKGIKVIVMNVSQWSLRVRVIKYRK
jgi:hypothetical protein